MKNKCVFVIGPESSGSMLIAKIISHVLDSHKYGEWNGIGWSDKGVHKVYHRSLPYGYPSKFPNLKDLILENEKDYDIYFILTTRDISISEVSRFNRWAKPFGRAKQESEQAREIMITVMNGVQPYFIWSYETFMFLKKEYLKSLYQFLGVESDSIPNLIDANQSKVRKIGNFDQIKGRIKTFSLKRFLGRVWN